MATPKEQHDARANAINTGSSASAGPLGESPSAAHAGGTFREGLHAREATGGHREPPEDRAEIEGSMGGTSDAGTAADDAAEAAAFHRGLPDDKTQ